MLLCGSVFCPFLLLSSIAFYGYTICLSIHQLSCFQFLTVVNKTATNTVWFVVLYVYLENDYPTVFQSGCPILHSY
jgi:hypothetical protein